MAVATLALLLATVLALTSLAAAQATPSWWRALYRGTAGSQPLLLDLTLAGATASGRLLLPAERAVVPVAGSSAADGALTLAPTPQNTGRSAPAGTLAGARLDATRSLAPNDDGNSIAGHLTLGTERLTLSLSRVAQYVRVNVQDGPIQATDSYPHFLTGALAPLNAELGPASGAELTTFVREGRSARAAGGLFHAWQLIAETTVEGVAGPYVSLLTSRYRYTGGAHGIQETATATWWLDRSGPRRISLAELFAPGADYVARLAPLVLADLRAQGATWVVQGQVSSLSAHDLALYVLTPAGLSFTFPPYAMGPYVQGTFTVVVPYAKVLDMAAPNGALQAFASAGR